MTTWYLVPSFNKSEKDKINEKIDVLSPHAVVQTTQGGSIPAISSEGFPANRDATYVFVTFIEKIVADAEIMIGFTSTKTVDSNSTWTRPGLAGMNGVCLNVYDGNLNGGTGDFSQRWNKDYLPSTITKTAKEIVAILTISNSGTKKSIQFVVDGNEGLVHECATEDFENKHGGSEMFAVVTLSGRWGQKLEMIPFDQVKSRSPKIDELMKEFSSSITNISGAAIAGSNNNNAAALAQLQQELEKERKRADLAESQFQNEKKNSNSKDSKISTLEQENANLKQQLQSSFSPSAFIKDKPYQIDFAANGLPLPTDRATFGSLLPVAQTSPTFLEAKKLMRKLGTFYPSQKPVAGFTLEGVDVIAKSVAGFEDVLRNLQQMRPHGGGIFNPSTTKYSAEQLQVLIYLNKLFLDRPSDAHDKAPDLINVFHGTKRGVLQSVVNTLVATGSTDAGFFGVGAYTTPNIEYAARYATGEFNHTSTDFTPRADGSFPVIWCVAAVGVCYPLTREKDYGQSKEWNGMSVSDFFGSPLKRDPNGKFDCHCVLVNESANYQAVPRDHMQYMEIVFDQTSQVLPIAVLWMKPS